MNNILLIDDDDLILPVVQNILEHLGYNVIVEIDPIKALNKFKKRPHSFDLIITDQSMPVMKGSELINEMWLIRKDMKFVLCTGHDPSYYTTNYFNEKIFIDYLQKPFNMDALINVMNKALPFEDI